MEQQPPRCPRCGRDGTAVNDEKLYWCGSCAAFYDDDPDEGGGYLNDPKRSVERKEEYENRRKGR